MKILLVVGTRPQIIKSAPLMATLSNDKEITINVVHTGQHYDYQLAKLLFEELKIPDPIVNLQVGSGSPIHQTVETIAKMERVFQDADDTSLVIVPGDTTSALGVALASVKFRIPIAHVEAGPRIFDMRIAEEVNRRLVDHCSTLLFAPTDTCFKNLKMESVLGKIYLSGDVMYDAFLQFSNQIDRNNILHVLGVEKESYAILTLHRYENVEGSGRLQNIFDAISSIDTPVIFPAHPRTRNKIKELGIKPEKMSNIRLIEPLGYIEMMQLLKNAQLLITDSGGLQKEAFWSKIPTVTLRKNTEWIETVQMGYNSLVGTEKSKIRQSIRNIQKNYHEIKRRFRGHPYGKGDASKKIHGAIKNFLDQDTSSLKDLSDL